MLLAVCSMPDCECTLVHISNVRTGLETTSFSWTQAPPHCPRAPYWPKALQAATVDRRRSQSLLVLAGAPGMQNGFAAHTVDSTFDNSDATAMDISLDELHLDQEEGQRPEVNGEQLGNLVMDDAETFDDDELNDDEEEDECEEDWDEEDDRPTQYDLRQYGVYQSLPIPSGPPDMQSDCDTAEEYIKRVR